VIFFDAVLLNVIHTTDKKTDRYVIYCVNMYYVIPKGSLDDLETDL
jgi:hypothetical protein